jgi:cytochrome c oxidase subunit 2
MISSVLNKLISRCGLSFGLLCMFLSGCSRVDHKQSALDPKGLVAQNQYDIFMLSVWITIFLFCAVGGCLLYVLWKYRVKNEKEAKEVPPQSHGNSKIEFGLILASSIILVILAVPTLQGVVLMNRVPNPDDENFERLGLKREQVDDAITVNVTGKRYFWVFEYPQFGIVTANEIVFPATKAVRINLRSQDVIHSFWLPKLAGKMDVMPGHENFMWFIADEDKITQRYDADGNFVKLSKEAAMPSVFDGKMREAVFKAQEFNATFEPVGGLFYGQCAEFCGNSHAYMSFRGLAQSDDDFDAWVKRMQDAQNPNRDPSDYDPEQDYKKGSLVKFVDESLGEDAVREFRALQDVNKGEAPNLSSGVWEKAHSDDYVKGEALFNDSGCIQCHVVNRSGIERAGPNLTLFGLRTSLAAGWMRNNEKNLIKWLRNSEEVKMGNLMWNGVGITDDSELRKMKKRYDDDGNLIEDQLESENQEKARLLAVYLLGQK